MTNGFEPLIPADAITLFKAQGQTLKKVVNDLVLPPFARATSRATSLDNILLLRNFKFEALNIQSKV